jgi:hypothetical protein
MACGAASGHQSVQSNTHPCWHCHTMHWHVHASVGVMRPCLAAVTHDSMGVHPPALSCYAWPPAKSTWRAMPGQAISQRHASTRCCRRSDTCVGCRVGASVGVMLLYMAIFGVETVPGLVKNRRQACMRCIVWVRCGPWRCVYPSYGVKRVCAAAFGVDAVCGAAYVLCRQQVAMRRAAPGASMLRRQAGMCGPFGVNAACGAVYVRLASCRYALPRLCSMHNAV